MSDQQHEQPDHQRATAAHHPDRIPQDVVEAFAEQEIAEDAPEGRAPSYRTLVRSRWVLAIVSFFVLVGIILVFWALGTAMGILVTIAILFLYVLATAPAWGPGILQRKERRKARQHVREELGRSHG